MRLCRYLQSYQSLERSCSRQRDAFSLGLDSGCNSSSCSSTLWMVSLVSRHLVTWSFAGCNVVPRRILCLFVEAGVLGGFGVIGVFEGLLRGNAGDAGTWLTLLCCHVLNLVWKSFICFWTVCSLQPLTSLVSVQIRIQTLRHINIFNILVLKII